MAWSRKVGIELVADTSNLERGFSRAARSATGFNRDLSKLSRGVLSGSGVFRSLHTQVALASSAFLGGAGLTAAIRTSIEAASHLHEMMTKTDAVFGDSAKQVKDWSNTAVASMGLASDQSLEAASSIGALLRPLGVTGDEAAKQGERLTKLGADLASFYDTSVQDALDAIRSGLVGEVEPLRRYAVVLSEARVQQEALRETGKKHAAQLTTQEKVIARIALIYKDTAQAQGDFARTSGGAANQLRIFQAGVRQLQIGIGQALLPTVLKIVTAMNTWLAKSENQKRVVDDVKAAVQVATTVFSSLKNMLDGLNRITGSTKRSLELLASAFVAFKTMKLVSTLSQIAGNLSLVGTNAEKSAGKVRGLRGALLGIPELVGVTILIETVMHKKQLDDWAKRHHLGFLTGSLLGDLNKLPGPKIPGSGTSLLDLFGGGGGKKVAPPLKNLFGTDQLNAFIAAARKAKKAVDDITATAAGRRPLSLLGRFNLAELRLAQAELTKTLADDRRVLVVEKAITEQQIAHAKSLKDKIALTQQLVGINGQILSIDQEHADALQRQKDLIKQQNQALKDRADAIKSAILDRLQRQQTRREDKRAIEDAREQLRIAKLEGGPGGIRLARRDLTDALFQMRIFQLEAAQPKLRRLPGGQQQFGFGGVTVVINGVTDPDKVAAKVVEVLRRRQRRTSQQQRGVNQTAGGGGR